MRENELTFSFKARYFTLGDIHAASQVWFVLHGYGQLAKYFIRKFEMLTKHRIYVIAPEGLSRFYLEELQTTGRKNNRVGATWMTQENRLMDIENYLNYLTEVYQLEIGTTALPVTVLGFSQGSATASRWILDNRIKFDRLILWAGIFPHDMDFETGSKVLHGKDVSIVYGNSDPFLNDTRFSEMKTIVQKLHTKIQEVTFDGEHEIDEATLKQFLPD
jgi:predicted esterase